MKQLLDRPLVAGAALILCGMLGMAIFQGGACLYTDLAFLHSARVATEKTQAAPPPAAQKVPTP